MNNPLSYSSLRLELFAKDGIRLKPASGFVVETGRRYYLITNRHILISEDIAAGGPQDSVQAPYVLKTSLHMYAGEDEKPAPLSWGTWKRITMQLYDDTGAPRWIERRSDKYHPAADIVALPVQVDLMLHLFSGKIPGIGIDMKTGASLKIPDYWTKIAAIPLSAIDTDVEYGPPDTVYVIGHPLGWAPAGTERSSSAFWRKSSIAAEMNEPGMPQAQAFFIDPCAPEGMTGSPVIGMKTDRLKLLGVYSDRPAVELSDSAGFVWDAGLLKELIGGSQ